MQKGIVFAFAFVLLLPVSSIAQIGSLDFARPIGGTGDEAASAVAVDPSGNIYLTGFFEGTVDFDPSGGVFNLTAPSTALFVVKLDPSGNFLWAKQFNTTNSNSLGIAVDSVGSVYTTGWFSGAVDFDPGAGTFTLTSMGGADIFLSKLDSSGNFAWALQLGDAEGQTAEAIALDAADNIYMTGSFRGTVDFDPGAGTANLTTSALNSDIFVLKLDSSANYLWAGQFGGTNDDGANAIALDDAGDVYTTGWFRVTSDFDPGAGVLNLTSFGSQDVFVCKLDTSGALVWVRQLGGTGLENGCGLTIDYEGNVLTTGDFADTIDMDPGAGTFNLPSPPGTGVFISKLDSSGDFVWAKALPGDSGTHAGPSIATDDQNNVYTTGQFDTTGDFDPGPGTISLIPHALWDGFVSKLNSSGNYAGAWRFGGGSINAGSALQLNELGHLYLSGYFSGSVDFDPGAGIATHSIVGGSRDLFVLKTVNLPVAGIGALGGTALLLALCMIHAIRRMRT